MPNREGERGMGDAAQFPTQIIALPKGGGAVRGVGETFTADPQTGTGSFTVPLTLPAGRGGLQPALTLGYGTGAGNRYVGLGWSISLPGIARKTCAVPKLVAWLVTCGSRGPVRRPMSDDDDTDVFVLSGRRNWCRQSRRSLDLPLDRGTARSTGHTGHAHPCRPDPAGPNHRRARRNPTRQRTGLGTLRTTPAAGDWTLDIDRATASPIIDSTISDILLIITCTGRSIPWPT
jgi:hypothetical protein